MFALLMNAESTPQAGLPLGGQTQLDLKNNHFEYALTWSGPICPCRTPLIMCHRFSLSLFTALMLVQLKKGKKAGLTLPSTMSRR